MNSRQMYLSFTNDEALSSELAGHFFLAMDKRDRALQYFIQAHEKYHDWGVYAKSDGLFEFVQTAIGSTCLAVESTSSSVHGDHDSKNPRKSKRLSE